MGINCSPQVSRKIATFTYPPHTPLHDSSTKNAVHTLFQSPNICRLLYEMPQHDSRSVLRAGHRHLAGRRTHPHQDHQGSRTHLPRLLQESKRTSSREERPVARRIFAYTGTQFVSLSTDIRHVSRSKPVQGQGLIGTKGMASPVVPSVFLGDLINRFQ